MARPTMMSKMMKPMIFTIVAIAVVLLVASRCTPSDTGTTEHPIVPDVVGMTRAAATGTIERTGFKVGNVTEQMSVSSSPGTVLSQNPVAGTSLKRGSAVDLVLVKP